MPAPTKALIKSAMQAAVAAKASLTKADGGQTSPAMADLLDALAEAVANAWSNWPSAL